MKQGLILIAILISAFAVAAKNDARANIRMVDGTQLDSVQIDCPHFWSNDVKYIANGKKTKIKSTDIDHIIIWHIKTPDNKAYLKYWPYGEFKHKTGEYKINEKRKGWFFLEASGKHLAYWVAFYQIKVKDNKFEFKLGDSPSAWVDPYFFQREEDSVPYNIPLDTTRLGMVRDWLKAFLSKDSELVERITDKGYFSRRKALRHGNAYNPFFFEDIAVDYNPNK